MMARFNLLHRSGSAVLAVGLLACSCQEREANKMIEVADRHFREARYEEAQAGYEEIMARWPESSAAIRAAEGLERMNLRDLHQPAPAEE